MDIYTKYCLNCYSTQDSVKTSIGIVTKNPEMLSFAPDHLKTRTICKHTVKKITLSIIICF